MARRIRILASMAAADGYRPRQVVDWASNSEAASMVDAGLAEYVDNIDEHCPHCAYAIRQIEAQYGQRVSISEKAKSLVKFGHNHELGTSWQTIWEQGGDETYIETNGIDSISSSDNGDTEEMYIEGHTISGSGASAEYTFVAQTVTLSGQTKVALSTPLARCSRAYVNSANPLAGDFYVYQDTAITAGVPDDATKIHMKIAGSLGETQSFKAATTFSNVDYFILTGGYSAVQRKQAAQVDLELQVKQRGSVFRPATGRIAIGTTGTQTIQIDFRPYVIIPANSDVRIRGIASATGVEVHAAFMGYLAVVT